MTLYAGVTAKRLLPADWYLSHMLKLPRSFAGAQYDKWEAGRIARNADYKTHRPLKGKRLTTFCASLALLHPLLSLTHWIFRSLMLPYKSSSHSAKCVRCVPRGRYHHPRPEGPSPPLSEANTTLLHNPRRSRAPFFIKTAASAATTTL